MPKLNLIQCGVGGHGRTWLRDVLPNSPDFELVAMVDVAPAALAAALELHPIEPHRQFPSLAAALAAMQTGTFHADAVLTVAPPAFHLEHTELALDHGLHVLTEKPIADSLPAAKRMATLAARAGRQLVVSQDYRYRATSQFMRQLVQTRAAGDVAHGHIDFYIPADFPGTFRQSMRFPLLIDMCIHHVDLVRAILGRNIRTVTAYSFRPPWSWFEHEPGLKMLLELEGGIPISYSGDWTARGRCTGWDGDWRLQCEDGAILWEDGRIAIARCQRWRKQYAIEYPDVPSPVFTGFHATLHSFAEAIRTGAPAPTAAADNLQSFATVMAAVASATEHRTVDVQQFLEQG